MLLSGALARVRRRGPRHRVLRQRPPVELPLLAATVEQLDVVVAVQLEVPVGVGGEPVVVAAVEDHGVVVGDTAVAQQLGELLGVDEVTPDGVLQIGTPVQLHGPGDVAAVVGAGVLVDLDEDDVIGIEIALGPVGGDQDVGACHMGSPFGGYAGSEVLEAGLRCTTSG